MTAPSAGERADLRAWPGLHSVPTGVRARAAALVARRLFFAAVARLDVSVRLPDGSTWGRGGPAATVARPDEFFARLGSDGLIGFGEAYLTGAWEADDLAAFLTVLAREMPRLVPVPLQLLRAAYVRRPPRHEHNSTDNTRDNIAHHYDLSNDLFDTFLDDTLSYSAAVFDGPVIETGAGRWRATPPESDSAEALAVAQRRKIDRLLDRTGVGPGSRVLEIGTGWGELAIRAAARGAVVHSITLSSEQQALAQRRIAEAGFADGVTVDLCDYRSLLTGVQRERHQAAYNAVVSVEMIEAVGHDFWPDYFAAIDRLLAPGGRAGLQAITMPHDRMLATRRTHTWIQRYIFPGGFLPSLEAIDEVSGEHTTLRVTERFSFGSHYAETLRRWDAAFLAARHRVLSLGFDETFVRMWHFYLAYSRAGFASGYLDVHQLILDRGGSAGPVRPGEENRP